MATIETIHCPQECKSFTGDGTDLMTVNIYLFRRDLVSGPVLEKYWHNIETMVHAAGVTKEDTIDDRGNMGVVDTLCQQRNSGLRNCVF